MTPRAASPSWRLLIILGGLYLTQGIPLGVAMEALPALLLRDGASLVSLSLLPLVGVPWIVKFLWGPLVDNHWSRRWGKRRSWILPMQAIIALCLVATAMLGVSTATAGPAIALLGIAALASATQDTATDGLAAEQLEGLMLVHANTIQVAGTMVGFFVGGSGCLILTGLVGQRTALLAMAAVAVTALILAAIWRAPAAVETGTATKPRASLRRFLARPGALGVLAIGLATAMTASAAFGASKLFLVDRGWPLESVGRLGMAGGVVTIVLGCGGGGWLTGRFGVRTVLPIGVASSGLSALGWTLMAANILPLQGAWPALAVLLGSFGGGAASVAAMTLAMGFAANAGQAGTDMTVVQSARDAGEMATSAGVTALAAALGFGPTFGFGIILAAIVCVALVATSPRQAAPGSDSQASEL